MRDAMEIRWKSDGNPIDPDHDTLLAYSVYSY